MQSRDKNRQIGRPIERIIARLIGPLVPVSDPVVQRRMQILASLLLIVILIPVSALIATLITGQKASPVINYFLLGLLLVTTLLQYISRTRRYPAVAFVLVAAASAFPFVALITGRNYQAQHIETVLIWLLFSILLSASLLPLRLAIGLIGCVIAGVLALPMFLPQITYQRLLPLAGFLSATATLVIANLIYREKISADQRNEALAEKEFSDGILNGLPGVFLICDGKGRLKHCNQRLTQVTGYSSQECADLSLPSMVSGKDRPKVEGLLTQAQNEGKTEGEISIVAKSGLRFPFYFTIFSYGTRDQRLLVWYGADTTEFKRLEEAYRAVVEHSLQGLAIYQQGRIVFTNPAYAQMLGYSLEELYAMDSARTANLIYFEDSPRLNEHMQATLSGNAVAPRIEFRVVRKDGTLCWIETTFNVIQYRDQPALQATSVDIGDRKQMESEQARLIRELETKNAELERFTYTVSHDLKSPLITIRGFLGFLERDTMANNKARIAADVQRITEATEKMQRLLNDVLSLSRIGRVVNPPENAAFGAIAAEAVERVAGQIRQRSVYVKIADGLPVVRVDRERVIEVVQNLLDNAVKFMGDQWNPTIQVGMRGTDHNSFPILFVEDNGIGIDPVFHEQVFGLFNKLDPSSEGTGIGLAIVKRVIETHGGRIWVESEGKGKGAKFLFTLPPVTAIVQPGPAK